MNSFLAQNTRFHLKTIAEIYIKSSAIGQVMERAERASSYIILSNEDLGIGTATLEETYAAALKQGLRILTHQEIHNFLIDGMPVEITAYVSLPSIPLQAELLDPQYRYGLMILGIDQEGNISADCGSLQNKKHPERKFLFARM